MTYKLILLALLGAVLCREVSEFEITTEFSKFLKEFGRDYATVEDTMMRYRIFSGNYRKIQELNEEENGVEYGVNQFADLTEEEFRSTYLTYKPSRTPCSLKHSKTEPKQKIDWREKGAVNRVKNQGACGSCWAFSAIGSLEGRAKIKSGKLVSFSEQELVDCSREYGDNQGCGGGDMNQAFEYIKDHGIAKEEDYPYEARNRKCRRAEAPRALKIAGCVNVTRDDNDMLLEALAAGPVSISVTAGNFDFRFYRRGVLKRCGRPSAKLDHGITLVGAGDENGQAYWIAKNSWGTGWGSRGYVHIKRDTGKGPGMCQIARDACYPVV